MTNAKFSEVIGLVREMDRLNIMMNDDPKAYEEATETWKIASLRNYVNKRISQLREELLSDANS